MPHKMIVPELSVAFIGILLLLFAQAICFGVHRFHNWRKEGKRQPAPDRPLVQTVESPQPQMNYSSYESEQLPAYPDNEQAPPPYVERPPPAHVASSL